MGSLQADRDDQAPTITAADLGPLVPRRGTSFSQALGVFWLKLIGWKVTGTPPQVAKAVLIGAPHTSNRDGFVAAAVILTLRLRITCMVKAELFKGPVGSFLRWLDVMPLYRTGGNRGGQVDQVVARFAESDRLYMGIAPEGTRHASPEWRRGFYHMAIKAGVPIIPFVIDFGRKELRLTPAFYPTGDMKADMELLIDRYRGIVPADPSRLSGPLRQPPTGA